jgi:S-DNA-T family DNA segregation ATPase FtsK/SpoIIIE
MRSLLDHQADGIEYTLHSHGIEANVVGGNISPRLIQFHIKLNAGVKYNRVAALADELALALGVNHCRITRDGYFVKVEVPRPDPVAVRLFPLMRNLPGDLPENSPILGLDESGVPLLLRMDSPDIAHILISGTTGSGKTVLARSMIASLALQNPPERLKLLLIDPKGRGYRDFNGLPHLVCPVVTDPLDGLHRLKWAVRHMEKRDENGISSPLLVIFVDELADLIMVNGREMEQQVARLTQRGREAGIHLVACTQKPSASVIGGIAKSNFPTRVVGRVVSSEDARVASGIAGSGADKLMGRGDFLLLARGEVIRLQGAHISPSEMQQTVTHLGGVPVEEAAPRRKQVNESRYEGRYSEEAPQRQEFRRKNGYEPEYDELDYEEEDYYEQPARPSKANRVRRQFQAAPSNTYQDESREGQGVAERLARYQASLQQRRQSQAGEVEDEDDPPYYPPKVPPRRQPVEEPARPATPKRPQQQAAPWDEPEDEFEDEDLDTDEAEEFEEVEKRPAPPRPRPAEPVRHPAMTKAMPNMTTNRTGGINNGQSLLGNLTARKSDSFKKISS